MTPLSAISRIRLTKLLGMLGSDHAGERDNAGVAAHKIIKQAGLTWEDLLDHPPPLATKTPSEVKRKRPAPSAKGPTSKSKVWHSAVSACLQHLEALDLVDVAILHKFTLLDAISAKQQLELTEIYKKVLAWEARQ